MDGEGGGSRVAMSFAVIHKYEGRKWCRILELSQTPSGYSLKSLRLQIHVCEHEIHAEEGASLHL